MGYLCRHLIHLCSTHSSDSFETLIPTSSSLFLTAFAILHALGVSLCMHMLCTRRLMKPPSTVFKGEPSTSFNALSAAISGSVIRAPLLPLGASVPFEV